MQRKWKHLVSTEVYRSYYNTRKQDIVDAKKENITIHMPQRTSKILLVRLTANENAYFKIIGRFYWLLIELARSC